MRKKYRKIVVDGVTYLWTRRHGHIGTGESRICVETFTARELDSGGGRLVIQCTDGQGGRTTMGPYGHEGGVQVGGGHLNLNLPSIAAAIIRAGVRLGWDPQSTGDYVIDEGFAFLETSIESD